MPPKGKEPAAAQIAALASSTANTEGGSPAIGAGNQPMASTEDLNANSASVSAAVDPVAVEPVAGTVSADASEEALSGEAGQDASLAAAPTWIGIDLGYEERAEDMLVDFTERFPKLTRLLQRAKAAGKVPAAIKVNSHTDGFRRAGMRHPFGVNTYPLDHFEPAQIEIMLGEPALTVELV
jgi:hypothetical protein